MAAPSMWLLFITQGPPNQVFILLNTMCFSTTDLDSLDNFQVSQNHPLPLLLNLVKPPKMQNTAAAELLWKKALCNGVLNVQVCYNHSTFHLPTFLTTLMQECFKAYISNEFHSPDLYAGVASSTTNQEPLHKEVNATISNSCLNPVIPHAIKIATTHWVCSDFPWQEPPSTIQQCRVLMLMKLMELIKVVAGLAVLMAMLANLTTLIQRGMCSFLQVLETVPSAGSGKR